MQWQPAIHKIRQSSAKRFYAWELFYRGNVNAMQALELMLPSSWQSTRDAHVRLLGRHFLSPKGLGGFLETMYQMVKCNQYRMELVPDRGVIIDGGSSSGIFAILAARKCPHATIYAFEPSQGNYACLERNVRDYPNIRIFRKAIGDRDAEVPFTEGDNFVGESGGASTVPMVRIDDLDIPLSFLKMDIEGLELEALRGAAATIERHRPVIVMSAYHKPEDKVELPGYLGRFGYACELRRDCEEDFVCVPA